MKERMQEEKPLDVYTDGASRGNPGPSCYAYIFVKDSGIIREKADFLGRMTNNAAEYHAVHNGLQEAFRTGYRSVRVLTDSELVQRQITGSYRVVNPVLVQLCREVLDLARQFRNVSFHHVPRSNPFIERADALCNYCLDAHKNREIHPPTLELMPIGVVHAPYNNREEAPRQGRLSEVESVLEIFSPYEPGLRDIADAHHLIVLYWAHNALRDTLVVHPPRSRTDHGVFATRSPDRPNPVLLCVVRLLGMDGNRIRVQGLDATEGSLIVDIKPFSPEIDCPSETDKKGILRK
ncbi:MAG: tRNA (N6-threonylcarbamoyladenosine(37)-N6)-methyltransferase TrmO [Methanomicrobiales archaeon]|nr:tRNA (N6-threonylcarbamoyladenosine(37)-N6)-methyltransferase TrmO [Methanomicrobiales archaeon]